MSQQSMVRRGLDVVRDTYIALERWILLDKHSLYGASAARILSGCAVLGILISNFRARDVLFGQGSVWNKPMQDTGPYWEPGLVEHLGNTAFLFYYLAVIALAALFVLGWHTRLVGALMLIGHVSIIERMPVLGDQGDNILRIGVLLLLLTHSSEYWSLDARRRARTQVLRVDPKDSFGGVAALAKNVWNSQPVVPRWFTNGVHNVVLIALAAQVLMVYFVAGMYKAEGELWSHGTAIYYPMQLQEFRPFPFLSDALTHVGIVVGFATYLAVVLQIGFAFALLHPVARRIAIFCAIMFHLSIAILMALPWFSLSMIAFDAIFVSASTFVLFDAWVRRGLRGRTRPPTQQPVDQTAPAR